MSPQRGYSARHEVRQFHFTAWPEHGVPYHATGLLAFIRRVKASTPPDAGPVVIHCRWGAGVPEKRGREWGWFKVPAGHWAFILMRERGEERMTPKGPLNFGSKVGILMSFPKPGEALGPDTKETPET